MPQRPHWMRRNHEEVRRATARAGPHDKELIHEDSAHLYDDNGQSRFTDIDISLNPTEPFEGVSGLRASAPFSAEQCFFFSCPLCVMEQHVAPRRGVFVPEIHSWLMTRRVADTSRGS